MAGRAVGPVGTSEPRAGQADGPAGEHNERHQGQRHLVEPMAEAGGDGEGAVSRHSAQSYRDLPLGQERAAGRRLSEMSAQAPALQAQPAAWSTVGAYVALTKPRIIELLLVTTLPTMVVAKHGLPSLWLMVATLVGGTLAAGGANAINMVVDRDIDRLMNRTKNRPLVTGAMTPRAALVFALTPRGGGLRRAVAGGQPALGRAGRVGHAVLRLRLHPVAQAPFVPEHRDRRGRRGRPGAGRVGGGDRQPLVGAGRALRRHLHLDPAPLLGPGRALQGGLRRGGRADVAGGGLHEAHHTRDRAVHRGSWWRCRCSSDRWPTSG